MESILISSDSESDTENDVEKGNNSDTCSEYEKIENDLESEKIENNYKNVHESKTFEKNENIIKNYVIDIIYKITKFLYK